MRVLVRVDIANLVKDASLKELAEMASMCNDQIHFIRAADLTVAEIHLVKNNLVVDAIKAVRRRLSCGLVQAKEIVDCYNERLITAIEDMLVAESDFPLTQEDSDGSK